MGNKPTRAKDSKEEVNPTKQEKHGKHEKTNGKKSKPEGRVRGEGKWKPGRSKKTRKQNLKAPVTASLSSGYSSPTDHLVSSDSLFRTAILSMLPDREKTYSDDTTVIEAFEEQVKRWRQEYDDKCLALEALAVTIQFLLSKQDISMTAFDVALSSLRDEQRSQEKSLLRILSDADSDDDQPITPKNELEKQLMDIKAERNHLADELEKLKSASSTSPPSSPTANSPCAKCKDVSAEIESLHIVLDMKKKEVQKLNVDRMKLLQKFEKYYELEKKYEVMSREKEAMSALLENKSKFERQLSIERDSLVIDLEKEARKVAQLSMEKEEIIWKARHHSLSSSTPNLNEPYGSPAVNGFGSSTPTTNNNPDISVFKPTHCSFTIHET